MARKSRGSREELEAQRAELSGKIERIRDKIARIRESDVSRLEKTRKINHLRGELSKIERELTDL